MASCRNCIHSGFCYLTIRDEGTPCEFVDKTKLVEVVRCKDCKYAKNMAPIGESEYEIGECLLRKEDEIEFMVYDDDYCSYGERKDNK